MDGTVVAGWDASLDPAKVRFAFSEEATMEVRVSLEKQQTIFDRLETPQDLEGIKLDPGSLPAFMNDMMALKEEARTGHRVVVAQPINGLSLEQQLAVPWLMSQALGRPLAQNEQGHLFYIITDRGGRMEEGARYSQTRQGGSFHTDGVNLKEGYEFFLLHCAAPAAEGGESVLLDGHTVFRDLAENAPEAVEILKQDRVWEYKGVRPGEFYEEPVLRLMEGRPEWRYLRDYLEEAGRLRGAPLAEDVVAALDRLDESLANPAFQFRCRLCAGETVVVNDKSIFHGRTSFRDNLGTVSIEDRLASGGDAPLKRTYCRFWVNP